MVALASRRHSESTQRWQHLGARRKEVPFHQMESCILDWRQSNSSVCVEPNLQCRLSAVWQIQSRSAHSSWAVVSAWNVAHGAPGTKRPVRTVLPVSHRGRETLRTRRPRRDRAQISTGAKMLLDSRHMVKDAEGKAVGVWMMCPCCLSNSYTKITGGWSK